ncbi:hypothetical protein CXG81DRAFT_20171 [Caulochytrium protostelioides]|uniref:Uncharacterized protein n=1 Tax=Caulochytrium protostelioides TaxID=1555241 RepID=A0A4P9X414_9FUNG|nr:hypothetical protein CXG81DRAFT_20171 [Caulochytrium protostelioides]|eukprot:RKO99793.1 hypothetical protein CXG81DRAFT_20171 [Caulochytrium protostelioides]
MAGRRSYLLGGLLAIALLGLNGWYAPLRGTHATPMAQPMTEATLKAEATKEPENVPVYQLPSLLSWDVAPTTEKVLQDAAVQAGAFWDGEESAKTFRSAVVMFALNARTQELGHAMLVRDSDDHLHQGIDTWLRQYTVAALPINISAYEKHPRVLAKLDVRSTTLQSWVMTAEAIRVPKEVKPTFAGLGLHETVEMTRRSAHPDGGDKPRHPLPQGAPERLEREDCDWTLTLPKRDITVISRPETGPDGSQLCVLVTAAPQNTPKGRVPADFRVAQVSANAGGDTTLNVFDTMDDLFVDAVLEAWAFAYHVSVAVTRSLSTKEFVPFAPHPHRNVESPAST